jgi:acyl carrier protein
MTPSPSEQPVVRREQLPLPRPYVAPRTPTERQLAEIWCTLLSMDRVGVEDAYHDLGGDSFLATTMLSMIDESFGVTIPLAALVEGPTIAGLAQRIDRLLSERRNLES